MSEVKYVFRVNGEERFPTDEERKKMYSTFVQALGYRPVQKKEDKESKKKAI